MKEIKVKCLSCGSLEKGDFCGTCHTVLPIGGDDVDFFRLFELEPRPAVDTAALKATFLDLSQKLHPDRNVRLDPETRENVLSLSAQLNRGYATLSNTKERLRYLVGKEREEEPTEANRVPAEIMELFFEVHDLMQEADAYLKRQKPAGSRIVAAVAVGDAEKGRLLDGIRHLKKRTAETVGNVEAEVGEIDARWEDPAGRPALLERLSELADVLSYLGRLKTSLDQKELALTI